MCWEGGQTDSDIIKNTIAGPNKRDGVFTGGPTWTTASQNRVMSLNNPASTTSFTHFNDVAVSFPGTIGVDVRSSDALGLITNNPLNMAVAVTWQMGTYPNTADINIVGFGGGTSSSGGFAVQIAQAAGVCSGAAGVINWQFSAVQNNCFDTAGNRAAFQNTLQPHRILLPINYLQIENPSASILRRRMGLY